jgi:ABC-type sugar transport system substrate-binding protein
MSGLARLMAVTAMLPALLIGTPAVAQPQKAPTKAARIGVLYPGVDNSVFQSNFSGFREGLRAAGYVEGGNLPSMCDTATAAR